jgi:PiT family inorganic phosphate transporter
LLNACILGAGASRRLSAVRWGVAGNILVAWILTLPLSAAMAYVATLLCERVFG